VRVLILDNYDSFVYNLAQLIGEMGSEPTVYRNDAITLQDVRNLNPDAIVISPGPGTPTDRRYFGVCLDILREISPTVPTLGVCLGHQGIVYAFGGRIVKASRVMHGKVSEIRHDGLGIFQGVRNPFTATRYHSLVGDPSSIPYSLEVSAISVEDGEVMGVRHRNYPVEGVQFHPESILTGEGHRIMENFLEMSRR